MRKSRLLLPWDLDSTCSPGYCQQRALASRPPPAHPIPVFKSGECSFCLSSFRCLQENPEIWDIPWKLCSPGVSGLRGNSEPTQDGVGNRALMGGSEDPPPHTPPPGPELLASADKPSSLSYRTSLEAPWTDSHPRLTSIPLTALLFPPLPHSPNIEVCFEVEPVSGLIETRPPSPPPCYGVSS